MRKKLLTIALLVSPALLCAADAPQTLIEAGHCKRARTVVEQMYRANPGDPETLWAKSRLAEAWKDLPAALDFAEKALAANPKEPRYHLQVAGVVGAIAEHASLLRQISMGRRFKKEIDAALALDPRNVEALDYLIGYYFMAPAVIGGDKARARGIAEQIMQIDAVAGYKAQIEVAQFDKQKPPYEEIYRKAIAARPSAYMPHINLGAWFTSQKRYDEAMDQAREALRIDGGRTFGHTLTAIILADEGKWSELDGALAQAEKQAPDDFSPYFRAGSVCLTKEIEFSRAERYFHKYLSQEPEPESPSLANAHWRLGQVLEKEGRKPEAVAEWRTAVQMDSNSKARDDLKRMK